MAKETEKLLGELGGEAATCLAHLRRIASGDGQAKALLADVQTRLERIRNEAAWARADLIKAKPDDAPAPVETKAESSEPEKD